MHKLTKQFLQAAYSLAKLRSSKKLPLLQKANRMFFLPDFDFQGEID